MKPALRLALVCAFASALAGGAWLASKSSGPDRRDIDPLVTVGGDVLHDAIHPALDLTRMTPGEEAALGDQIDAEARAAMTIGGDARTEAYLSRVLHTLTVNVRRGGIPYTIALVRSPEVNAFAVAGGRIYVTEGLLAFTRTEAELAAVIGHEVSHVDLRHCVDRLQLERAARKIAPGAAPLARLGYEIMLLGFSEEQELSADGNGALLAARGGYDPWGACDLFERFRPRDAERERTPARDPVQEAVSIVPQAVSRYLATHPPADERIEAVRRVLGDNPAVWRGERRYVGRANLAARRAMAPDARDDEWIVRTAPPG